MIYKLRYFLVLQRMALRKLCTIPDNTLIINVANFFLNTKSKKTNACTSILAPPSPHTT